MRRPAPGELTHTPYQAKIIRVGGIAVHGDRIEQVRAAGLRQTPQKPLGEADIARQRERPDPGLRLLAADDSSGPRMKLSECLRLDAAPLEVRLIPNLPLAHAVPKMTYRGRHPAVPGRKRLVGRRNAPAQTRAAATRVVGVAVAQFKPGAHASGQRVVHDGIEPAEIKAAALALALLPAGLQANARGAELADVVAVVVVHRVIAVERLTADGPGGFDDLTSRPRFDLADVRPVARASRRGDGANAHPHPKHHTHKHGSPSSPSRRLAR